MSRKNILSAFLIALSLSSIPTIALAGDFPIGSRCNDKVECASENCEESDLPPGPGESKSPSYCTCDVSVLSFVDSADCKNAYTGDGWSCNDNGSDGQIPHFGVNFCVKDGKYRLAIPDADIKKYKPIGAKCSDDKECLTDNCESSALPDSQKFCVCDTGSDYQCAYTYGKKTPDEKWTCKDGDTLSLDVNYCLSDLNGRISAIETTDTKASQAQAEEAAKPQDYNSIPPKITIPIPNLPSFVSTKIKAGDTVMFPWIGSYLLAIIKYMLGLGALLAVLSLAAGGILYIAGGASPSMIAKAKGIMWGSLSGTIILISSYMILYIVNPRLTDFPNLAVESVKPEVYSDAPAGFDYDAQPTAKETLQKKCSPTDTLPNSITGLDISKLQPIRHKAIVTVNGEQKEKFIADCSQFANCTKGRQACLAACLAQIPADKRSKLAGPYSPKYLGQIDCNTPNDGKYMAGRNVTTIGIHEGPSGSNTLWGWWSRYLKDYFPVSSHYFVTSGGIYQILDENYVAGHGVKNYSSIGIDIYPNCKSKAEANALGLLVWQTCTYPDALYKNLNILIAGIKSRHPITQILGHCEVEDNKADPRNFDWRRIGLSNEAHQCLNKQLKFVDFATTHAVSSTNTGCCITSETTSAQLTKEDCDAEGGDWSSTSCP